MFHIDAFIENDNNTECMALCGRLLAALEMLKVTLNAPRFVRTESGLVMMSGEAVSGIH
ncbi:hypothetical protein [Buttiauxella massiliensis]|uniref:hypothetical protein n=1 Tax=Buttiauxella massiliensis TaxID=2831590 RepID=UPI001869C65F|nr:hypothetical protein [Buttiauxella massiliensis]